MFDIRVSHNGKAIEAKFGGFTFNYSYETLVGIRVPLLGQIASENVWGPTTGRHLNSFSDKKDRVPRWAFLTIQGIVTEYIHESMTGDELRAEIQAVLDEVERDKAKEKKS